MWHYKKEGNFMSAFLEKFEEILNEASTMELEIANMGKINIINDLKKIKRTGKKN